MTQFGICFGLFCLGFVVACILVELEDRRKGYIRRLVVAEIERELGDAAVRVSGLLRTLRHP